MAFCQIWIIWCLFHFRNTFFPSLWNSLRNKRLILPRSCMGFSVQVAEHPAWDPACSHPATPPWFPDRQRSCASLCSQLRVSWHKSCLKALMKTVKSARTVAGWHAVDVGHVDRCWVLRCITQCYLVLLYLLTKDFPSNRWLQDLDDSRSVIPTAKHQKHGIFSSCSIGTAYIKSLLPWS